MKYSHNYPKLFTNEYTTIRRYPKGKIGDVHLEIYPAGKHYAEIVDMVKVKLYMLELKDLLADTYSHFNRNEVYALFQSFYKKPIDFSKDIFYMYYMRKIFGDECVMCNIGVMNHLKLYYWKCTHCGFSYQIDPAGKTPKITILNRGKNYGKKD